MASTLRKPQPPAYPPPPSVIPNDTHILFKAYKRLHEQESEKPEEERLGGDAYFNELLWILQDIKDEAEAVLEAIDRRSRVVVIDGEEFEEIEVEDEDESMETR